MLLYYNSCLLDLYVWALCNEVWDFGATKSSCKTELREMTPHFELLTQKFL